SPKTAHAMEVPMKRAIIFLNGELSDPKAILPYIDEQTLLIGCDGGTKHILALGLQPSVIIGDFDSYSKSDSNEVKKLQFPAVKDHTDSELAIQYAKNAGYR